MDRDEFPHEAIAEKGIDLVQQALAEGADPDHVPPIDGSGSTALFWAVFAGHLDLARPLLEAGASVAAEAEAELSSLHAAAEDVNLPMINLFRSYAVEPIFREV